MQHGAVAAYSGSVSLPVTRANTRKPIRRVACKPAIRQKRNMSVQSQCTAMAMPLCYVSCTADRTIRSDAAVAAWGVKVAVTLYMDCGPIPAGHHSLKSPVLTIILTVALSSPAEQSRVKKHIR